MSKKSIKVTPAVAVENANVESMNAAAQAVTAQEVQEVIPSVTAETSAGEIVEKFYNPHIDEGMQVFEMGESDAPAWSAEIPGKCTFISKVRASEVHGAQTFFNLDVCTEDGRYIKFRNANCTQVKSYFGLVSIQRGTGESRIVIRTEDEITAAAKKLSDEVSALLYRLNVKLSSVGYDTVKISPDGVGYVAAAYFTEKNQEAAARIQAAQKAAEEKKAAKEADAKLKAAKAEQKKAAAAVLTFDEIQMAMQAAVAAKDFAELSRLTAIQMAAAI